MALVPTHQFYPRTTTFIDSFQSSVTKLHVTTRLKFFRYGYSIPFKNQILCETHKSTINSDSTPQQNPQKRSNFDGGSKNKRWGFASEAALSKSNSVNVSSSSNSWLDKWNEHKQNKLKGTPQVVVNYRNSGEVSGSDCEESSSSGSTMERIVEKLKKFGYVDDADEKKEEERAIEKGSIEDIFYVEEGILPNARGGFSEKSPFGDENVFSSNGEVRFPWEKKEVKEEAARQKSRSSMAELTLPESELRRLKNLTIRIKNKMRIGGSGVTGEVVEKIHEKWKSSEVVRLKIEGASALNMKRMHEILEVSLSNL